MPTQNINGFTCAYDDRGRGTPLVLVHGFPVDRRMWRHQLDELSDRHRVIAIDLRSMGQSPSNDPLSIELLADDVHALLKEIGALPCVLGGLSMGGYVTLTFARKYADDLRGIVLFDTRADADSPTAREGRAKTIEMALTQGAGAVAAQMLPRLLAPETFEHQPDVVAQMRLMGQSQSPVALANMLAALRDRPDQTPVLPALRMPALIIVGQHDAVTPPAVAESMRQQIPQSQLVQIPSAGHMSPLEQPQAVNAALRDWLETVVR